MLVSYIIFIFRYRKVLNRSPLSARNPGTNRFCGECGTEMDNDAKKSTPENELNQKIRLNDVDLIFLGRSLCHLVQLKS